MRVDEEQRLGTVERDGDAYVLRLERALGHPVERVWAALTDPRETSRWIGPIELEPVVGGSVTLRFERTMDNVVEGRVTAIDPTTLIEYTFGSDDSVVRWELHPEDGGCRLVFTHTLPASEDPAKAAAGWHTLIELIPGALEGELQTWTMERWQEVHEEYAAGFA